MKVILQQDVANVGRKFQIVDVPKGYALNKLVPRGLAVPATNAAQKQLAGKAAQIAAEQALVARQFDELLVALQAEQLQIPMEANEQEQLFQALSVKDVVRALAGRGLEVAEVMLVVPRSIKSLGEHTLTLTDGERSAEVSIKIVNSSN